MSSAKSEAYFNLKLKLEELGYNNTLPLDAIPLVECILADLLQTTRSLQHYMDLSKESLLQRESLLLEAEPYKCENVKLIQDNNRLHKELMALKEANLRVSKESKRKVKSLSDELMRKDSLISKLQHEVRDLTLKSLCADTYSSRNRSKRKDAGDTVAPKICICNDRIASHDEKDLTELNKNIKSLEDKNEMLNDEIALLQSEIEHRDNEIVRLNIMLESRPLTSISKACTKINGEQELTKRLCELEKANGMLQKELDSGLEKQHEAMLRALSLADKNKCLQEELKKVDALALKLEGDCNKRLAEAVNEINFLHTRVEGLSIKNSELEADLSQKHSPLSDFQKVQESLESALKEKKTLQKEIKDLVDINKNLQDKLEVRKTTLESENCPKCQIKDEIQALLKVESIKNEKNIADLQKKLAETINLFNKHNKGNEKFRGRDCSPKNTSNESAFIKDLHNKLCVSEQKILLLKKENDELKYKVTKESEKSGQNYKDIINQLNMENSELSKENISLSQQLMQYKNSVEHESKRELCKKEVQKLMTEIDNLSHEIQILKKDKKEYNFRYKEAIDMVDKLKRDLCLKQKEVEQLHEENCSYKLTHRTGRASAEHLKDECDFLREQIKRMQSDVIKEKTLASQIKNIQLETERGSNELQNELLCVQKKLHLSKDTIDSLKKNCEDLQSEIVSLKHDKSNLIDSIKKVDQERDKLVIELDHKTESNSVLQQKLRSQTYEIGKLDNEISELKRKLNINKVSEHKLIDFEAQIKFLNGELLKLTQQYDSTVIENKQLQNSLADANGTLKVTKIEYEKSRREVDGLKQQLQHYVAEIRRIEEMLTQKESERSDMLDQFASLSVEANILETTNHSLENESASKSAQLQTHINKIQHLESKLMEKETMIENQATQISAMACKVATLESEIKLVTEEKTIFEQNVSYLKQMCQNFQSEQAHTAKGLSDTDSELKLYENRIKNILSTKGKLEMEKEELQSKLAMTDTLLSNSRREVVDLKLALQDAISETKSLQEHISKLSSRTDPEINEAAAGLTKDELELPLMLEETIHEVSHEEDVESSRFREIRKRYTKYSHGSTL